MTRFGSALSGGWPWARANSVSVGSAREIEEFLYTHPDVLDAQVIGVPDAHYGEELCAWLTLRPEAAEPLTAEAVRAFASGKLAHYKIHKYVNVSTSSR